MSELTCCYFHRYHAIPNFFGIRVTNQEKRISTRLIPTNLCVTAIS